MRGEGALATVPPTLRTACTARQDGPTPDKGARPPLQLYDITVTPPGTVVPAKHAPGRPQRVGAQTLPLALPFPKRLGEAGPDRTEQNRKLWETNRPEFRGTNRLTPSAWRPKWWCPSGTS